MKIPKHTAEEEIAHADIWTDDETAWWYNEYREDYWDGVAAGEMSWQWYMKLDQYKDWHTVIINKHYKNITVANWIKETYPGEGFEYEHEHFLIEKLDIATIVALKWT